MVLHKRAAAIGLAFAICTSLAAVFVSADSIVSGNVFCDQCLHGRPSMWGVPIHGAKVLVRCRNMKGMVLVAPALTNFLGAFAASFPGRHDLHHCSSKLLWSPMRQCNVVANSQESIRLEWKMNDNSFYSVKPLYFKPVKPMPHCPISKPRAPAVLIPKPPQKSAPVAAAAAAAGPNSDHARPQPSYCRADHWMNPVYKCRWKFLSPDESISKALGPKARERFGDISLMQALAKNTSLNGISDGHYAATYNSLLSQTVAALLNSYFSSRFSYSPLTISREFSDVIWKGTIRDASKLAMEFRKANAGIGKGTCLLQVCKQST